MNAIEISHIKKTFGDVEAVKDLSISVPKGTIYGFIGPNGSGKTTTIRMIMNILIPDSGEVVLFQQPHTEYTTDQIGYLPEERGLYTRMKVRDLLIFYARLKGDFNPADKVDHWLKRLSLADWSNKKVETLSKGMSQKVQFIATVVTAPALIILDEPFSGLDPVNMEVLRDAILELRDQGSTIIFSTHDMNVAEQLCDFILMIYRGEKVLDGTLSSIQEKYGTDTLRVRIDGDRSSLKRLDGVERVTDLGQVQELRMQPGTDPQQILKKLVDQVSVLSFDIIKPSLHDIFVRIAGPAEMEVANA